MTTYKEKLVMFVKLKRNHIKKFNFVYADHRDYRNIRSWSEEKCKDVYNYIVDRIVSPCGTSGVTDSTCPWCIYKGSSYTSSYAACVSCYYGKRYGRCLEDDSAYKKYATEEVEESLTNEVYREMIYKINQ